MTCSPPTNVLSWRTPSAMRALAVNDKTTLKRPLSRDGTILSPSQHRALAGQILDHAGKEGFPTKERAQQMAANHEVLAAAIENRAKAH